MNRCGKQTIRPALALTACVLLGVLPLTGCQQTVEVSDRAYVRAIAIDRDAQGVSCTLLFFQGDGDGKEGEKIPPVTAQGGGVSEAMASAQALQGGRITVGHCQYVVLGGALPQADSAAGEDFSGEEEGPEPVLPLTAGFSRELAYLQSSGDLSPAAEIFCTPGSAQELLTGLSGEQEHALLQKGEDQGDGAPEEDSGVAPAGDSSSESSQESGKDGESVRNQEDFLKRADNARMLGLSPRMDFVRFFSSGSKTAGAAVPLAEWGKDGWRFSGAVLTKGGVQAGQLTSSQTRAYQILREGLHAFPQPLTVAGSPCMTLVDQCRGTLDVRLEPAPSNGEGPQPQRLAVTVRLKVQGRLVESADPGPMLALAEEELSRVLNDSVRSAASAVQETGADLFGLENLLKKKEPAFCENGGFTETLLADSKWDVQTSSQLERPSAVRVSGGKS